MTNILIGVAIGYFISCVLWIITVVISENTNTWVEDVQTFFFAWFITIPLLAIKKIRKIFKKTLDK